jgi:hypothetical protein
VSSENLLLAVIIEDFRDPSRADLTTWRGWRAFPGSQLRKRVTIDFTAAVPVTFRALYMFVGTSPKRRNSLYGNMTAHPGAQWTAE